MAVSHDIFRTWRAPRVVIRDILARGQREDRVLAYLLAACLLMAVSQWPRLSREAAGFDLAAGAEVPDLRLGLTYALFAWIIFAPLIFYMIAWISHLIARVLGGSGTSYGARLALFWALLAMTPVSLLYGLLAGFVGPVPSTQLIGVLWLAGFLLVWLLSLIEVQTTS